MEDESFLYFRVPADYHIIYTRIEFSLLKEIEMLALETGLTRSEVIERCLTFSLDHLEIVDPE